MRTDNKRIIQNALDLASLFRASLFWASLFLTACGGGGGSSTTQSQLALSQLALSQLATPAYYVSPTGNNANPGTLAQPWHTLTYAVTKLKAGDTLYARAGVYAETVWVGNSGTAASPITITAYPGESPIIDGATLTVANWKSLLALQGSYITASGFELRNMNLDGAVLGGYGVNMPGTNDTISSMNIHDIWSEGVSAQGDYSIVQDSKIWRVAQGNCRLSSSASCGITATLYGSALFNPTSNPWPGCVSAKSTVGGGGIIHNATIQRNVVHDCWGEGISTFNANGTTIQDNVIYDNWAQNLFVDNASNVLVQRNIVYNTPNNYVQANSAFTLAEDLAGAPPSPLPLASHNTVINNFVYNARFCAFCWTLMSGSGLNNVLIANNTIINSDFATGSGGTYNITNTNSTIANNIVSGGNVTVPSATGLSFSNNLWATAPPAGAVGAGDVIGNPQLAASGLTGPGQLSASYFKLQATSPMIGKGMSLIQVPTDFFGKTRKAAPDIGGDESP